MGWVRDGYRELRGLLRRERADEEVAEEMEHHLASLIRDYVAAGMSVQEAEVAARRRFGDVEEYRRRTRAIDDRMRRRRRWAARADGVRVSLRLALRSFGRRPGFAGVAVSTLAFGIGATTAIFTLLDAVVLTPLPYRGAERLVAVEHPVPGTGVDAVWGLSYAGYFHFREHSRSLAELAVYLRSSVNLAGDGEPERVTRVHGTASLLPVLGARPLHGRLITQADDAPPGARVAVLGHAFWVRRYGADASVIGRTIELDGVPVEVVGVLEPGVEPPRGDADLWMPLGLDPSRPAENSHIFTAVARLRDGVGPESARADLARLVEQFSSVFPQAYPPSFMRESRFDVAVVPLREHVVGASTRLLWILLGSVGLVLLIAVANVANLFLVRAEATRREVAVRAALGAGRGQLAWHYLTESLVLALLAGAAGVGLAFVALRWLVTLAPGALPRLDEVSIDGTSVAAAALISVLAGVAFGLFPLTRRSASAEVLREGGRGATASGRRQALRGALVAAQVALALVLLAASALLLESFRRLSGVDPGVRAERVLTFELTLPLGRYGTHEKVNDFYRALTRRLEAVAGVRRAGTTTLLPVTGTGGCSSVWVEGRVIGPDENPPCVSVAKTTPGFAEAMGMRVRGRTPSWSERGGTGTALVTAAAAARLWPGMDPIGRGIRANGAGEPYYRVVGVVDGVRATLDQPPLAAVYFPVLPLDGAPLWAPSRWSIVTVATDAAPPERYLPAVVRVLSELDPQVPLANAQPMTDVIAAATSRQSFMLRLLAVGSAVALLLSTVGVYGVVSYVVARRSTELGIRLALGARARNVTAMVVAQSLRVVAIGIVLGVAGALAFNRLLSGLLFGVRPTDARVLGIAALLLFAIALGASWAPARRAARVQPLVALRSD